MNNRFYCFIVSLGSFIYRQKSDDIFIFQGTHTSVRAKSSTSTSVRNQPAENLEVARLGFPR